jgi:hypothetical protein
MSRVIEYSTSCAAICGGSMDASRFWNEEVEEKGGKKSQVLKLRGGRKRREEESGSETKRWKKKAGRRVRFWNKEVEETGGKKCQVLKRRGGRKRREEEPSSQWKRIDGELLALDSLHGRMPVWVRVRVGWGGKGCLRLFASVFFV